MLEVKVREFRHTDYDSYAAIHNAFDPTHALFLERAKDEDSCFGRTRYRMKRYVAESDTGEIVAVGGFEHLFFSYHPHTYDNLTLFNHVSLHREVSRLA